ncbi:hypothetical protein LXL04_017230 [Taraxacum kok-saghyz]
MTQHHTSEYSSGFKEQGIDFVKPFKPKSTLGGVEKMKIQCLEVLVPMNTHLPYSNFSRSMSSLTCFLFLLTFTPYVASLNFSFPTIGPENYKEIVTTGGGAYISVDGIQVTPELNREIWNRTAGRATYFSPLHLWDNNSNELANFSTSFTFVIDSYGSEDYGNGLTFFLAENISMLEPNLGDVYGGGAMGLPVNRTTNRSNVSFVAVEFDTFYNPQWDPINRTHVGININNLSSVSYAKWWAYSNIPDGLECQASIKYDSVSKNLSVTYNCDYPYELKNKGDEMEEPGSGVEMNTEFEMGTGARRFSHRVLARSTGGFAGKEKLGEGGFGEVYKGYKIAHGLASALLYLHEDWEQCVLHRDIKSSNVMLDSNFNAKLGDFGLAKLVDHEKGSQTTLLAGTLGYLAPECVVTGKATRESDVFSFGVVALEIACGRKPIVYMAQENQIRLVEWVWGLYGTGTILEATDPRLGSDYEGEEITRLMILGLWCVHPNPDLRPSMRQVIQVLNSEASLPILPSKMPVASYLSSPMSSSMSSSYGVASVIQNQSSSSASKTGSSEQKTISTVSSDSPNVSLLLTDE